MGSFVRTSNAPGSFKEWVTWSHEASGDDSERAEPWTPDSILALKPRQGHGESWVQATENNSG
jgi:hypothetical protein